MPSGLKPTKFSNMEVRIYSNPSPETRLFTATFSSSPGWIKATSKKDIIQDKTITKAARNTNKINGSDSLFPMLSILFKNRDTLEALFSFFVDIIVNSFRFFSYLQLYHNNSNKNSLNNIVCLIYKRISCSSNI